MGETKKKTGQINLTDGPILKALASLSLPIMASAFLGTAYNITDMAWIGLLGSKAVAGVGAGGMYVWLSQGLVALARMGGQVNVAQCCGKGDRERAAHFAAGAIQLTVLFGILFGVACLLFTDPLLGFFALEDQESYSAARVYMQVTCGLILFSFMNLTLTGLFTAQGDSKTPFLANLIGLAANMVLDPIWILGIGHFPRMEVFGAAAATVTAQFIVMLVMLFSLKKRRDNVVREVRLFQRVPSVCLKEICRIGIPTALQSTVYCMISMVLTRMASGFGAGAIATFRVGGQIESLSWNTADGFGAALNAFVGQNYGAGKMDRVKRGYALAVRTVILWGALILLIFVLFPRQLSQMFFHEEEVILVSISYLVIIGICEPFMCVELTTVGALSGLGRTKLCSIISILLTGARIPLALILCGTSLGVTGLWWALTISSVSKGIVFYIAFCRVIGKTRGASGNS